MVRPKMPSRPVRNTTCLCLLWLFSFGFFAMAQTKTTKGTQLIVIVSAEGEIAGLELFEEEGSNPKRLLQIYPQSDCFLGALRGRYQLKEGLVIPIPEATVTIFKEHVLYAGLARLGVKKLEKRNRLPLGKTTAMILENTRGELTLKIMNNEN